MLIAGELTERIIGLAIEVHRHTGRGLLESVYEQCLCHELRRAGIPCERQVPVPVFYKGITIGEGFRADIVVAQELILEIKSAAAILPAHEAQLHTYLTMSGLHVGLILNFNARRLTDGIRRHVMQPPSVEPLRLLWPTVAALFSVVKMPSRKQHWPCLTSRGDHQRGDIHPNQRRRETPQVRLVPVALVNSDPRRGTTVDW